MLKLTRPGCQQGWRLDRRTQAGGLAGTQAWRGRWAGQWSRVLCRWSLSACFTVPCMAYFKCRLLDATSLGPARESAFLASSMGDLLQVKGPCREAREGN